MGIKIGLISDTHGQFDRRLKSLFREVNHIICAGDIGGIEIIRQLFDIAPTIAVSGNTDVDLKAVLPEYIFYKVDGIKIFVCHIIEKNHPSWGELSKLIYSLKPDIVVYGHTHTYVASSSNNIIFVNPGSAGASRYPVSRTCGIIEKTDNSILVQIYDLSQDIQLKYWQNFIIKDHV
ncbi:MAG: metallophosphatase family protein [Deltaproteobacteria bacterium]|nr:metallophosphatase family protein [Deltaproteobacteria bacterium]